MGLWLLVWLLVGVLMPLAAFPSVAHAQLMVRPTVFENVTIHGADGSVIEGGTLIVRGRRIAAVGKDLAIPRGALRIDAAGLHATPGLIDPTSGLAMPGGASGGNALTANAGDAFDRYDRLAIEETVGHGVTLIAVSPTGHRGFGPATSVIRLQPAGIGAFGEVMEPRLAITLNMRSEDAPVARLLLVDSVRTQLREAREREKAIEAYEVELEEFLKKAKEKENEKEKAGSGNDAAKPPAPARPGAQPQREAGPQPGGDQRRPRPGASTDAEIALDDDAALDEVRGESAADGRADDDDPALQQRPPRRGAPPPAQATPQPAAPQRAAPTSKRPQPPAPNRALDVLIEAINHEIPVRVQADRSEDILNALRIAEEFDLKIVLEGAAEAHLVASELAAAGVPVILAAHSTSDLPRRGNQFRTARDAAAVLERAGVEWAFGSGAGDSRHLLLAAQLLVQQTGLRVDPLDLVTQRGARILGVDDRLGTLAEGMQADVVLWNGDPTDPSSRVQRVLIAGETVYERKEGDS